MNRWEIWRAWVKFEDDPSQGKPRPVLVMDCQNRVCVFAFKITTHAPRNNYPNEYTVVNWEESGLDRPSTIRGGKYIQIEEQHFIKKLGRLSASDIIRFSKMLNKK
ncbi:MAG: type II toxin-antitoxin system PemK/MazF family toxin [Clostridia bacterium]